MGLKMLDSEIRSEDKCWRRDGWEDGGGEDPVLPLSFPFGGAASWKLGRGDRVTGEARLGFSAEEPPLISKLKALPLYVSFAASSNMLASLKVCLVCPPVTGVSLQPPM